MFLYISRIWWNWFPRWTVVATLLLGGIMTWLYIDHFFSAKAVAFCLAYIGMGIFCGMIAIHIGGIDRGDWHFQFITPISSVYMFLAKQPLDSQIGCMGGLWLGYVATISLCSLIVEIRKTYGLYHRVYRSAKFIGPQPNPTADTHLINAFLQNRPSWQVSKEEWELPPRRFNWNSLFIIVVSILFALIFVAAVFCILLD